MAVLVFIAPREFRDESLNAVKLFLSKWGVSYKIASYTSHDCVGTHGAIVKPDVHGAKISAQDYSGIIIVDGEGIEGFKIFEYRPMLDMILHFNNAKKPIMAIGNAIRVPARANVITGKKVSVTHDAETNRQLVLFHGIPSREPFEVAENLVTIGLPENISVALPKVLEMVSLS
ncbi:MAG TPA: DJ-1/PfpI family protein [Candidatus Baltobacteraceae bacterium]|nr:DJ-1/PfpI family protein [Candidatus Baltobacteraceae bacterium]